jgi:hypothetical protein
LLQPFAQSWHAFGWPVCGSSGLCRNEQYPVGAIVFLEQGSENAGCRLNGLEALKRLVSQMTINSWDKAFVDKAWTLAERMVQEVPVYRYRCDISKQAVTGLKSLLSSERSC